MIKNYIVGSKLVTLVDSQDNVLGSMDIFEAHRKPLSLHRASSVWLFKRCRMKDEGCKIKVLLQKRSRFKPIGAGWWGNGVCANVRPQESYEDCAYRRLTGELGIENPREKIKLKPLYKFEYQAYGNEEFSEHELDQVFLAEYDGEIKPNPDEVEEVVWVELENLKEEIKNQKEKILTPEESLKHSLGQLKNLAPPLEIQSFIDHSTSSIVLAPWTAIMLADSRLFEYISMNT